ncbi:MAG: carboxypeptidase-like regulatory domain-containing protein [Pirellulales bacterium]
MKFTRILRGATALVAVLGVMVNGPIATAAQGVAAKPLTSDVSLASGGVLKGQVLTSQGTPASDMTIAVRHSGAVVATAKTSKNGNFTIAGLRGGVHQVVAAGHQSNVRLWSSDTAPPAAKQGMLLVADGEGVVRGSSCYCGDPVCGGACSGLGGGGVWGTVGAVAIVGALAYAIYEIADDDSGS